MKKSVNDDIQNLFRKFGGDPESYREIKRDVRDERALHSWPIIAAMRNELQTGGQSGAEATTSGLNISADRVSRTSVVRPRAANPVPMRHYQTEVAPIETQAATGAPIRSLLGLAKATNDHVSKNSQGQVLSDEASILRKTETLNDVFLRLSNPSADSSVSFPKTSLRSMLGFAKK